MIVYRFVLTYSGLAWNMSHMSNVDINSYHDDWTGESGRQAITSYLPDGLIPASEMPSLFQGTNAQTWAALRHKGNGPAFVKVMRRVYYRRADVEAWIEQNRKVRTDQPVA
jgi:hypothetical protein